MSLRNTFFFFSLAALGASLSYACVLDRLGTAPPAGTGGFGTTTTSNQVGPGGSPPTTTTSIGGGGNENGGGGSGPGPGGGGNMGGGGQGPVGPADVNDGILVWLEAEPADLTLQPNDKVSGWADKSGNGHDALQAVDSRRPTYVADGGPNGQGAVDFTGDMHVMEFVAALGTETSLDYTLYIAFVQRNVATNTFQTILTSRGGSLADRRAFLTSTTNASVGLFVQNAASNHNNCFLGADGGQWARWELDSIALGNATLDCERAGTSPMTGSAVITGADWQWGVPYLGAFTADALQGFDGAISELALYNRVLTAGEIATLDAYFDAEIP